MIDRHGLERGIAFWSARCCGEDTHLAALLAAARAHLATLPRTKEIDVWHVEWWNMNTPGVSVAGDAVIAEVRAEERRDAGFQHVRVTGPHKHVVPA